MPENNFNKVSTLWACQTYMENMSKVLKPGEILFGVLFFSTNTASVTDVFEIIAQNMVHKFVPNPMELANFLRHLCEGYIDDAGVIDIPFCQKGMSDQNTDRRDGICKR